MRDHFSNSADEEFDDFQPSSNGAGEIEGSDFKERTVAWLRLLWGRRRFFVRLMMAALVVSTITAFLIPKKYESTTRLMPPDQTNSNLAMLSGVLGGRAGDSGSTLGSIAGDLLGVKNSADLFIGILQTRTVEDDLITKFNLRKLYGDRYLKDAREDLESHTDISADRKSGIIRIRVTDKDPKQAAAMAQEYVQELNTLVTEVNTSSAHRERMFLEGRLSQVRQDLESAEKNFSEFASKNVALDIPAQGKATIEASAALEGQLIVAQTELQGMRQIYADGNVRVRTIQAKVNELQRQLQQLGGKFDSSADPGEQTSQSLYPSIRKLPLLGVSYADFYRNTKIQEAVFETLTQEYELAKVQEVKETPSVKVIDPPDVPEKKIYPNRPLILFVGTLFPCLFCAIWIVGSARWIEIDQQDVRKVFVLEIFHTLAARLPSRLRNGSSPRTTAQTAPGAVGEPTDKTHEQLRPETAEKIIAEKNLDCDEITK